MSWSDYHRQSEERVASAEQYQEQGDLETAQEIYRQAAELEVQALASLDLETDSDTVGATVVNLVSLWLKANDIYQVRQTISTWLDPEKQLPAEIIEQLKALLQTAAEAENYPESEDTEVETSSKLPAASIFFEARPRSRSEVKSIVRRLEYLAEDRLKSQAEIKAVAELLEVLANDLPTLVQELALDPTKDLMGADLRGLTQRGRDLSGYNLDYARLQGADLTLVNLSQAELRSVNLKGADLSGANLAQAKLTSAQMQGTNLNRAKLNQADLSESVLSGASLKEANLSDANLQDCDLRGANLRGANLTRAIMNERTRLDQADLTAAILKEAQLEGVSLEYCSIAKAKVVQGATFNSNQGLSSATMAQLSEQGAIFIDEAKSSDSKSQLWLVGVLVVGLGAALYGIYRWLMAHPEVILQLQDALQQG